MDVWAKLFAADASEETKIDKCKAHVLAEIAARKILGGIGFHVSKLCSYDRWKRFLLIVDRPKEFWKEDEAGFLAVC